MAQAYVAAPDAFGLFHASAGRDRVPAHDRPVGPLFKGWTVPEQAIGIELALAAFGQSRMAKQHLLVFEVKGQGLQPLEVLPSRLQQGLEWAFVVRQGMAAAIDQP